MQFRAEKSASTGPKTAIILWYVLCTAVATAVVLASPERAGNSARQDVLVGCALFYIARAAYTLFVFVKRTVPWWEAVWGGSILGIVLFFYLLTGLKVTQPLDALDAVALLLYAIGSWLGTASELGRHRWKLRPENQGHLYTLGLFHANRHVNYFGDLLLFIGLGLLTRQWWAILPPLGMAINFAMVIIPAHDAYLASHYGPEFDEYRRHSKRLVPLLY